MTECIRRAHSYWTTCPCDTCTRDRARARKRAYVGIPHRIPNDAAWEVLAEKIEAGWTARALGSATGLGPGYFSRHVAQYRKGNRVYLGPAVASAVVNMGRPTEGQVGAEPSRRRLRALATIGHGINTISETSGVKFSTLAMIRNDRAARVSARIANQIADVYDELHTIPGDDEQAVRVSRQKGWPSPFAWDDIDHDEVPQAGGYVSGVDRRDVLRDLDRMGFGLTEACRRLEVTREALQKWCGNHGLSDLYRRLGDREHRAAVNQWTEGAA